MLSASTENPGDSQDRADGLRAREQHARRSGEGRLCSKQGFRVVRWGLGLGAGLALASLGRARMVQGGEVWPGVARLDEALVAHGLTADVDALATDLAGFRVQYAPTGTLPFVDGAFRAPLSAPGAAAASTTRLLEAGARRRPDLDALLVEAAWLAGVEAPPRADDKNPLLVGKPDFDVLVARIEGLLSEAAGELEAAFTALTFGERDALQVDLLALFEAFRTNVYVHHDDAHVRTSTLAARVDRARLVAAARSLAPLADPRLGELLAKTWRAARPPRPSPDTMSRLEGLEGKVLYARETAVGWFLIGAGGDNHYDLPLAFLLELGGDDTYAARATRADLEQPICVVVDLDGDDVYTAAADAPGQGAGVLGLALVADHEGDDRYEGTRFVQGSGLAGVGVLLDSVGDDKYTADSFSQGAGHFGLGLLVDARGADELTSHVYSQGFGAPLGVGLLLDAEGDDVRTATGGVPSSYGTEGEFMAGSQGAGFGFRSLQGGSQAAGGVGVLVDAEGDDVSQVGEFGFGCGYFLGAGIVRDASGNDRVEARRYGIATGAHLGLGIVLDDEGDDEWTNPITASLAGNWDLTLSYLCDAAGDDAYVGGGITLGGATITSLALLLDAGGKDSYTASGGSAFGRAGHANDVGRETRSIGLFLDLGGKQDAYPAHVAGSELPENDRAARWSREDTHEETTAISGVGLFLDE